MSSKPNSSSSGGRASAIAGSAPTRACTVRPYSKRVSRRKGAEPGWGSPAPDAHSGLPLLAAPPPPPRQALRSSAGTAARATLGPHLRLKGAAPCLTPSRSPRRRFTAHIPVACPSAPAHVVDVDVPPPSPLCPRGV